MEQHGLRPIVRWALLVALLFGVVLMHHAPHGTQAPAMAAHPMSAVSGMVEAPASHGPADHGGSHDQSGLHLCLAVLAAAFALIAFGRRLRQPPRAESGATARSRSRPVARDKAPPTAGRRLLALHCVIRC